MLPRSLADKLLVQELDEELLVYDQDRHKAHRLNATSGFIWRHCNGKRTVSQLAALLQREKGAPVDEDVVLLALRQLEKARLLRPDSGIREAASNISRRQLIVGAAIALPVITTILVPTPAQAASQNGCCQCKDPSTLGETLPGEQRCNTFCGGHGTGSYTFTVGLRWDPDKKKCVP